MSTPLSPSEQGTSTRPYLIRALHDWCTDNGFTPYLAVHVDEAVTVPMEYVKNNEIVLNVGFEATSGLDLGNDYVTFKARFGGVARDICVPVDHVVAIYARENGQGMAFPVPVPAGSAPSQSRDEDTDTPRASAARGPQLAVVPSAEPAADANVAATTEGPTDPEPSGPEGGGRPSLKRVK